MMQPLNLSSTRHQIRQQIRQKRRAIPGHEQHKFAHQACDRLMSWNPLHRARTVAVFLSFDGELDTQPLIEHLWASGKQVCLPVLHPFSPGHLLFLRYNPNSPLITNSLGIQEPPLDIRNVLPLNQLDILLIPLVAFDLLGQRLGMGKGFYDRTLQNWQQHGFTPVGYAHDCQQVEHIPAESWDIPLPTIITPNHLWQW